MNRGSGFSRGWRSNRMAFLIVCLLIAGGVIAASRTGLLAPVEDLLATPLNAVSGVFHRLALTVNDNLTRFSDVQTLQNRIGELETALALYQSELVELREINSDYQRLTDLLNYTTTVTNQETITANVIAVDQNSALRTITIDRGTRDGIAISMPVVTKQGLVGRVIRVSANAARIMLVNETSSSISARLQSNRVEGSVRGTFSGNLEMDMIPLDSQVREGDLVITSGLGGNFPPDLVIGQVTSVSLSSDALNRVAQVHSLVDFDTLEFVLVVTNFQPVDLSVFDATTP